LVDPIALLNNFWVLLAALLVFLMTMSVGLLEIGELGETFGRSALKSILISVLALFFMAFVGFNVAFAPALLNGLIGNPLFNGLFLGGFSSSALLGTWWSMAADYFNTGLTTSTYFLFETAFASVTLALVSVIVLKKVKLSAFLVYSAVYFMIIWAIPAAWVWNPTGWLYGMGVRDFAGGLVVHAAAGAAGLGILFQIWREEKKKGYKESPQTYNKVNPGWLTLAILLLWVGWFGFNGGSVLAFNASAMTVVAVTFLAASAAALSTMLFYYVDSKEKPGLLWVTNGILMGLIVITPLAGFVGTGSAIILGLLAGPLYVYGNKWLTTRKWFTDPIGLLPAHTVGGIFGVLMIAFFTQHSFAAASGSPTLPDGLLFGGGMAAATQLGLEALAIIAVMATVFLLSLLTCMVLSMAMGGITRDYDYPDVPKARKAKIAG
jgi:Amt family ammonium transporter